MGNGNYGPGPNQPSHNFAPAAQTARFLGGGAPGGVGGGPQISTWVGNYQDFTRGLDFSGWGHGPRDRSRKARGGGVFFRNQHRAGQNWARPLFFFGGQGDPQWGGGGGTFFGPKIRRARSGTQGKTGRGPGTVWGRNPRVFSRRRARETRVFLRISTYHGGAAGAGGGDQPDSQRGGAPALVRSTEYDGREGLGGTTPPNKGEGGGGGAAGGMRGGGLGFTSFSKKKKKKQTNTIAGRSGDPARSDFDVFRGGIQKKGQLGNGVGGEGQGHFFGHRWLAGGGFLPPGGEHRRVSGALERFQIPTEKASGGTSPTRGNATPPGGPGGGDVGGGSRGDRGGPGSAGNPGLIGTV